MADLIDVSTIINAEGELCGQPLLDAFSAVNQLCDRLDTLIAQTDPDGAILANGTVDASACLSYASDAQECAGVSDIPSWGQVLRLFNCGKEEVTTGSGGQAELTDLQGGGKVFLQLIDPVPAGVVGLSLSAAGTVVTALDAMGSPAPGVDICVQFLEFFG